MGTVRVTCGHLEIGKKVVCEGCFKALESKLALVEKERDELESTVRNRTSVMENNVKYLKTIEAQRDKFREALEVYERNHPHTVLSCPCFLIFQSVLSDGKEGEKTPSNYCEIHDVFDCPKER